MKYLIIVLAFFSANVQAGYDSYGENLGCGEIVEAQRKNNKNAAQDASWFMGWISASGWMGAKLASTDKASVVLFVTNYCNENPLKTKGDAARALIAALEEEAK